MCLTVPTLSPTRQQAILSRQKCGCDNLARAALRTTDCAALRRRVARLPPFCPSFPYSPAPRRQRGSLPPFPGERWQPWRILLLFFHTRTNLSNNPLFLAASRGKSWVRATSQHVDGSILQRRGFVLCTQDTAYSLAARSRGGVRWKFHYELVASRIRRGSHTVSTMFVTMIPEGSGAGKDWRLPTPQTCYHRSPRYRIGRPSSRVVPSAERRSIGV